MYNGIGLTTPRGSGTNGHVQRNWAFVRPKEKDKTYRTEEELCRLDTASNRPPNKEILDHERKRKIELKCAEFAEILEDQGFTQEAIKNKVNNYRVMLNGHDGKLDRSIGHWARVSVTETHHLAEAQQEKNARLREAFGISEYFVDGSSFDPDREAKEQVARSVALQEKEQQKALEREKEKEQEKLQAARYELVHTPSPEPPTLDPKKKKKHKRKDSSSSDDQKKKKKTKKRKKERSTKSKDKKKRKRKHSANSSETEEYSSDSEDSESDDDRRKKKKIKKKEKKKSNKKKRCSSESSPGSSAGRQKQMHAEKSIGKSKNKDKEVDSRKQKNSKYDQNRNRSISPKCSKRPSVKQDSRSRTPDKKYLNKHCQSNDRLQVSNGQQERKNQCLKSKSPHSRSRSPYKNRSETLTHDKYRRRTSRSPLPNDNNNRSRKSRSNTRKRRSPSYQRHKNSKPFKSNSSDCRIKSPTAKNRDSPEKLNSRRLSVSKTRRNDHTKIRSRSKSRGRKSEDRQSREPPHRLNRKKHRSPDIYNKTPPRIENRNDSFHNIPQAKTPPREYAKIVDSKREKSPKRKNQQQKPIVCLRSSSEDNHSDNENEKEDEEREKELRMLRLLKSGLAAKAKESLEKKTPKKQIHKHEKSLSPNLYNHKYHTDYDLFDIRVLPLKPDLEKKVVTEDNSNIAKNQIEIAEKLIDSARIKSPSSSRSRSRSHTSASQVKKSKSRSYSRSSYRSSFSSSSHHTISRTPSRANSSHSRSRSSSRSSSSDSSRSRSPSIPRRHGSPSFLDRRRITRLFLKKFEEMNNFKHSESYNFVDARLFPKVTTSAQCTEYHEVENLISDNFLARSRGFVAHTTTRPPIEITFELICPISIQYIILSRNLNHNYSVTVEVLTKNGKGRFTSIAYENFTSNGIVVCNPQECLPLNIDQQYSKAYFKSYTSCSYLTADWVKIRLLKTHRSVPSLGRVEIWGKTSKVCSEETVKAIQCLTRQRSLFSQTKNINVIVGKEDLEICEDFKDALTYEVMAIPVTLPSGNTIDQTTLDKCVQNDFHYGRVASDPFTGQCFTDMRKPVLNVALKNRIDMFLLQNMHRKETFSIQRTVGRVKRKIEEDPFRVSKVVIHDQQTVGLDAEETLNLAIERTVNSKGFIRFTDDSRTDIQYSCVECKANDNLYTISCNHYYCRNCLLFIYKTFKCSLCGKNFNKCDPKKLHP
ncbi:hypothetical protein FQR65_LT10211 [Abscondita terminalis]|nr:hypothetical protein FQR65_LT10211 [Abscondita terminalis]